MGGSAGGAFFLSDRWSDTLMSQEQLSRLTPFSVDWPIRETFAHCDFPYLRRKIDRGAALDARQIEDVWRANEACLDALAPLLTGDMAAWLPGVEEGEALRAMVEREIEGAARSPRADVLDAAERAVGAPALATYERECARSDVYARPHPVRR